MNLQQVEQRVAELYAEGTMWGEARAQWLESCLECGVEEGEQYADCDLSSLEQRAYYWAENLYNDTGAEWLEQAINEFQNL